MADEFLATNVDAYYGNLMVARCAFRLGDRSRARPPSMPSTPRRARAGPSRPSGSPFGPVLAAMDGDQRGALESFDEAFRAFRDLGLLFDLACHQLDMAAVFAGTPQGEAVAAEARAAFESMGAMGLAAQVDAVTAGARPEATHSDGQPGRRPRRPRWREATARSSSAATARSPRGSDIQVSEPGPSSFLQVRPR